MNAGEAAGGGGMTVIGTSALRAALAVLALAAAHLDRDSASAGLGDGRAADWQEVATATDGPAVPVAPACETRLDAGEKGMCRN